MTQQTTITDYVLEKDDLAVGLTRPALVFGVTITTAFSHLMLAALSYIYTRSFMLLPIFIVSYFVSARFSVKEPRFLNIYYQKFTKAPPVLNAAFWGHCNSYSPE
jgi:type IV secretion system protein VirB3